MKEEEEELRRSNLSKPFHDGVGPRPGPDPDSVYVATLDGKSNWKQFST